MTDIFDKLVAKLPADIMVLEIGQYQCEIENVGDKIAIHLIGEDISAGIKGRRG